MSRICVNYVLLGGQFFLLAMVLLLQCLGGIQSENFTIPGSKEITSNIITTSSTTTTTAAATTTTTTTTAPATSTPFPAVSTQHPEENVTHNNLSTAESWNHTEQYEYSPSSPVVLCRFLPEEFIYCRDPVDHDGNLTSFQELGHGCVKIGNQGQVYKDVNHTQVLCTPLDGIECAGPREFLRGSEPCIKYVGLVYFQGYGIESASPQKH